MKVAYTTSKPYYRSLLIQPGILHCTVSCPRTNVYIVRKENEKKIFYLAVLAEEAFWPEDIRLRKQLRVPVGALLVHHHL